MNAALIIAMLVTLFISTGIIRIMQQKDLSIFNLGNPFSLSNLTGQHCALKFEDKFYFLNNIILRLSTLLLCTKCETVEDGFYFFRRGPTGEPFF